MKRFLFSSITYLFLIFPSYASAQTNNVTLTTYYPAPFGAYDRLRLVPRTTLGTTCTAAEEGSLYIPNTSGIINQCKSLSWVPIAGGVWGMTTQAAGFDPYNPTAIVDQFYLTTNYDLLTRKPYVGIGTQNPERPLHIVMKDTGTPSAVVIENQSTTISAFGPGANLSFRGMKEGLPMNEYVGLQALYQDLTDATALSTLSIWLRDGSGAGMKEKVRFRGNGNVGILDPDPDASLEIAINGTIPYLMLSSSGAGDGNVLIVNNAGDVGVNTNVPTEKLEVNGNIKATTLILTSDAGLKTDIVPVENSLDKISRLKGVSFEWKNNPSDQRKHMGVIAQDVEKIFPEAVYGKEGAKGVDYPSLIAPLIEAVKELRVQNQDLKQQLRSQSASFQEQINSLQEKLSTEARGAQ